MSSTPRTDALLTSERGERIILHGHPIEELAELCRNLELALAKFENAELPKEPKVLSSLEALGAIHATPLVAKSGYDALRTYAAAQTVENEGYKKDNLEAWKTVADLSKQHDEMLLELATANALAAAQKVRADEAELKFTQPPVSEYDAGMGTTPGMWEMLSEAVDGEKLPDSLNRAIYALRDGQATVRSIK